MPKAKKSFYIFLFLLCIGFNIYLRFIPAWLPQLKRQAIHNLENALVHNTTKAIDAKYPDFNILIRDKIIRRIVKNSKSQIIQRTPAEYNKLKEQFQDPSGQTYLLGQDSYQWLFYTGNVLANGHPGNRREAGAAYDDYVLAPVGTEVIPNQFFFYISSFLYQVFTFFIKGVSLKAFLFYLPILYALVVLTLIYFFTRYIFSDVAAFFAVSFIGLNRIFLQRSCAGWFDYDMLTIILPLVVVWLLIVGLKKRENIEKAILYSFFASFFLGVYAFTWVGYWWILVVVGASLFGGFLNSYLVGGQAKREARVYLVSGVTFFLGAIFFCFLIAQRNVLFSIFSGIQYRLRLGSSYSASLWPHVFYTVAELQKTAFENLGKNLHDIVFYLFCLIGMLWIYLKQKRSEKKDFLLMMILWAFVMLLASLKGQRFIMFLAVPLGMFFGGFIEEIIAQLKKRFAENPEKTAVFIVLFTVFLFWALGTFIHTGINAAVYHHPSMRDSWHKTLTYIRKQTPPGSILNSWWDYGSFFKAVGRRRVIFDNQSQNTPLAYWMAKVLVSNDDRETMNILRMLNNSSDTLFDDINVYIKDDFACVALLNRLLRGNAQEAKEVLEEYQLPTGLKEKILKVIFFQEPAGAYFIVDRRMIGTMHNISFLGNWSFPKVYVTQNRNMPEEKVVQYLENTFSLSRQAAEATRNEVILSSHEEEVSEVLSKREKFYLGYAKGEVQGSSVYFHNGIVFDIANLEARQYFPMQKEYKKFKYTFVFDGQKFSVREGKDTDWRGGCLCIKGKDGWESIGLSEGLGESLFVKLYFLKAKTLPWFELFYADDEAGIYVYKINWRQSKN
ncbi:MAG: hypothetical protein JSW40_03590 [Candidatus Omnitrophota bacterium]|nr:MAG: hypothetical protein JSW40_03590 [Candidatus Omnitrophota bacterium]